MKLIWKRLEHALRFTVISGSMTGNPANIDRRALFSQTSHGFDERDSEQVHCEVNRAAVSSLSEQRKASQRIRTFQTQRRSIRRVPISIG